MRRAIPALIGLAIFLTGCVQTPTKENEPGTTKPGLTFRPDWADFVFDTPSGHSHRDASQHVGRSTPNFEIVAWDPLITDYSGKTSGGHLCGDVAQKANKRIAVTHSFVSDVAFVIIDVTDSTKPMKIGEYVLTNTHVYDLGITPDQNFVLLATDIGGHGEDPKLASLDWYFEDACTGERHHFEGPETLAPLWQGVVAVDIRNPKQPVLSDYLSLGGGHSIQIRDMMERTFALVTTPTMSLIEVTKDGKLRPVSAFTGCQASFFGTPVRPPACSYHDGFLQRHPITRQHLAYLANDDTMEVISIDDPLRPARIGGWNDWASLGDVSPSFLHEILPMETTWEDGKHYTFAGEECVGKPAKTPTCLIVLLDTTNPIRPEPVGVWTLPVTPQWGGGLMYSLHYIAYANGTLFVTNYHGGLWAVDVSTPEARRTMPTIGAFMPDRISPKPIGRATSYDMTPAVLDVNPISDGNLIVWDHTSGMYVMRFDASQPAPAPTPWKFK